MNAISIYKFVIWAEYKINVKDALDALRAQRRQQPIPEGVRIFPCESKEQAAQLQQTLN